MYLSERVGILFALISRLCKRPKLSLISDEYWKASFLILSAQLIGKKYYCKLQYAFVIYFFVADISEIHFTLKCCSPLYQCVV